MHINIDEIIRIKGRLEGIKDELGNALAGINNELSTIQGNVVSDVLVNPNRLVHDNIVSLTEKLNTNIDGLIKFMGSQMQNYQVSNEKAKQELQSLVQLLNGVYDKNGNITSSFTKESIKAGINQDAAGITDQSAYTRGEGDQQVLLNKIAGSQSCAETLETSYYYFKEKGLTDEQIAGILGNMAQESGFMVDAKNPSSTATGLFQWLDSRHPADWSLESQLDHAWEELSQTWNNGEGLRQIQATTTVGDATSKFAYWFEGFGYEGGNLAARQRYADACYWYIKNLQN